MDKAKYIIEYDKNNYGQPYKNKFTIVYENKTFYYCKVFGTDELKRISKESVDKANSTYFTSLYRDEHTIELEQRMLEYEKERLEKVAKDIEKQISWRKDTIENDSKRLAGIYNQIEKLKSHNE